MVKIGEVFWIASVRGTDEAVDSADELEESMGSVASTATEAANAQNEMGEQVEDTNEAMTETGRLSSAVETTTDLLGSSLFFTAKQFGIASAAAKAYAASLGLVKGVGAAAAGLGSFAVGAISASALITGGVAASALIVGTVATDSLLGGGLSAASVITGVVAAGSLIVGSVAAAALIVGTVATGSLIIGTIAAGTVIGGAVLAGSLVTGAVAASALIVGTVGVQELIDIAQGGEGIEPVTEAGEQFRQNNPQTARRIRGIFVNNPINSFGSMINRGVFAERRRRDRQAASGPGPRGAGLQTGGTVEETGFAQVHAGEAVLPADLVTAIEGGALSGGGSDGETSVEQNYDISIGDQSLDLSTVNRSTLRTLASMIDSELGTTVGNLAGGK